MSNMGHAAKGEPVPPELRGRVAEMVHEHGERGALELLRISHELVRSALNKATP
jgi:hypothetical protein